MNIKEILGPIRTNKKERKAAISREQYRQRMKSIAMKKFGPDKSLLHQYRIGKITRRQLQSIPIKKYEPIVRDDINPFKENKKYMKTKKLGLDSEFFK